MLEDFMEEDENREDLEMAVFFQLLLDANAKDVAPLQTWLGHLSDECLLHYLPQDHHMFQGLREESNIPDWFKTVPYVFNAEYVEDTIGRN